MALSKELLDILACPKCKGDIYLNESKNTSTEERTNSVNHTFENQL